MAQRVVRAFDGKEDEDDVAKIISRAGRGDEDGEIFAPAANPQIRAESDRQQKVARVGELHVLVQPVIAEPLQPHRRMNAERRVIGLDQVLVEPAWKDRMNSQADLFEEEKKDQRRIPVAEQAEDGNRTFARISQPEDHHDQSEMNGDKSRPLLNVPPANNHQRCCKNEIGEREPVRGVHEDRGSRSENRGSSNDIRCELRSSILAPRSSILHSRSSCIRRTPRSSSLYSRLSFAAPRRRWWPRDGLPSPAGGDRRNCRRKRKTASGRSGWRD